MSTTNEKEKPVAKPKRPYKRQTKATRVRKLIAVGGMSIHEIAAKAKVTPSYVYHIRWVDNKAAGIGSLRKPRTKVMEAVQVGPQLPYTPPADPLPETLIPISPYVPMFIATPKPTFWQRVRDFLGL